MQVLNQLSGFLNSRSARAFLVGGTVRDTLIGRERYDIDVTVTAHAAELARAFADQVGGAFYVMDQEHDVARVIIEREGKRYTVDFAQLRGETIEQDLATRDFTINAMAVDLSTGPLDRAEVIDPFGGRADLLARRVRAVSDSVFLNDPVRLLRAVRFEASLGFAIGEATEKLIRRDAGSMARASPERLRDEFCKIITAPGVVRNLERLDELGLLQALFPEVEALKGISQPSPHIFDVFRHTLLGVGAFEEAERAGFLNIAEGAFVEHLEPHFGQVLSGGHTRGTMLRIALLLHDIGKPEARSVDETGRIHFFGHEEVGADLAERALRRLRFSNEEIELVTTVIANHLRPLLLAAGPMVSDRAVYRYFRATGEAGIDVAVHAWCDERATFGAGETLEKQAELQAVVARLLDRYYHARESTVSPETLLGGRDVMGALGIEPGPRVGQVLDALREAQATGQVSTREQALDFVKQWQAENTNEPDMG